MLETSKIDSLVDFINQEIISILGTKIKALYLVGSYPMGVISANRPDVNWLIVWNDLLSAEDRWHLGKVLSKAINQFESEFTVRPESRPFKFSYPIKKTEYDVFVNISSAYMANTSEEFRKKNINTPDYIFAGFKQSRKLIFGEDILQKMEFEVSVEDIIETGRQKLESHKTQLDRIPLTYHLKNEADLVFNEALSHGKNLMYFGVEMLMKDEELRKNLFFKVFESDKNILEFYEDRFSQAIKQIEIILDSKKNFPQWKYDKGRAHDIYIASYTLAEELINYYDKNF